jgi:hypothetical protein
VRPLARPVARIIAGGHGPPADAVVSTYPLAGHAVAAARRLAPVPVPLISYVTDPAAHASWVVPGTDLYLTGWATTAVELWRHGPAPVGSSTRWYAANFTGRLIRWPPRMFVTGWASRRDGCRWSCPDRGRSATWRPRSMISWPCAARRPWWSADGMIGSAAGDPATRCHRSGLGVRHGLPDARLRRGGAHSGGLSLAEATAVGLPVLHYRPLVG